EVSAYAPVAIAGLGWLPDTIMSRSIIVRMRRRHAGEKIEPFRQRIHEQQGHKIREQVEIWAKTRKQAKDIEWPELPVGMEDRDAEIWESLVAIGDVIGGDWSKRAREAAVALVAVAQDREQSLGVRLLADLRTVFQGRDQMLTKEVLFALN